MNIKKLFGRTILPIFAIILLTFYAYNRYKKTNKDKENVIRNGIFSYGIIKNRVASKGNIRRIDYRIPYMSVNGSCYVGNKFYNESKIGDTIIVKLIKNNPRMSIIIESEKYKCCYLEKGKIWLELPSCK